jgi:transposase-like protein
VRRPVDAAYNLAVLHPEVAADWHPTRNGELRPAGVSPNSRQRVWWRCAAGHEWEAPVYSRTAGRGCLGCRRAAEAARVPPKAVLEDLYLGQRLSIAKVADRLGKSPRQVGVWLRRHDIPIRARGATVAPPAPGQWDHLLTRAVLEDLYVGQGLSALAVAERLGIPNGTPVLRALRRYGLPVAARGTKRVAGRPLLTADLLRDLYVDHGLSAPQIAHRLGYRDPSSIRDALQRFGIPLRRIGGESRRPGRPPLTRALLDELYVHRCQPLRIIGRNLGYAEKTLTAALEEFGIPIRRPGSWRSNFGPRTEFPRDVLVELYEDQELTIEAIAELFDISPAIVRQRLHEQGLPVRRSGPPPPRGAAPADVLLRSLNADRRVRAVLRRYRVPLRPVPLPPPDRSQTVPPPRLAPVLLHALYVELELSAFKIELLTGCDKFTVYKQLRAADIPIRSPAQLRRKQLPRQPLEDLYLRQGHSLAQVARQLGCSPSLVRANLDRYGLQRPA